MAAQPSIIRPTPFPRFDTLAADSPVPRSRSTAPEQCRHRSFSYAENAAAQPVGKSALLRDYSAFISSFTGDSEVCFHFSLRNSLQAAARYEIVQAAVDDEPRHENEEIFVETREISELDDEFGFGLEILVDPEVFNSASEPPQMKIPFVVQYHATHPTLTLYYDASQLDEDFADAAWSVLLGQLSQGAVSSPLQPNSSVLNHPPLQSPQVLSQPEIPSNLLHSGFQRSAAQFPDRIALHFRSSPPAFTATDEIFTYAKLRDLAESLADKLLQSIQRIPGDDTIVPAYMATSSAFYVSWLAVLKAGFAFCPLPTDAPPEQLRGILKEVGASVILTDGVELQNHATGGWYRELATCLDVQDFIRRFDTDQPGKITSLADIEDSTLAYVMYTSGSTGKPKGVKIHHNAAACSIASHSKFVPAAFLEEGFRWFQFAAPTFDPSVMEIFTTWWTGGTLCGTSRESLLTDPENAIHRLSATIMMATPSMASILRPERIPTLRYLWTMGERLTLKVISTFSSDSASDHSMRQSRKLLNAYGPTEGSINCTVFPDVSRYDRGSIIGQPIDTCSIIIIDPKSQIPVPVPLGFSGELTIGGPQVSQGYIRRPEQTAASFLSSPEYGRLYRTGDRARIVKTMHGELAVEYLGRIDTDQVKLSGRRVELGHIEAVISSVTGVVDAITMVQQQALVGKGSEQVVACLVSNSTNANDELISECRHAAEKYLPMFMRPTRYLILDSMPRSRSGKTDRRALTAISNQKPDGCAVFAASSGSGYDSALTRSVLSNSTMANVFDALADVCNIPRQDISYDTALLSIGLDSLRAVRFLQKARDNGITFLTAATVLRSGTVQDLVRACVSGEIPTTPGKGPWNERFDSFNERHKLKCATQLGLEPEDIEKVLPTTATQSGMIASFLRSVANSNATTIRKKYINHSIYYQASTASTSNTIGAWRSTLIRPDILRTVFSSIDDELAPFGQCVLSPSSAAVEFSVQRYACEAEGAWEDTLRKAEHEAEASICLERPPLRLALVESTNQVAYVLSLFHGIFDGGSLEILLQDVEDAYFARPAVQRSDVDHAVQKHFIRATEETTAYWNSEFRGFGSVPFPCVSSLKPENQTLRAQVAEVMANTTMKKLANASKAASVSPLSILQASWATILLAYTGSTTEVSFGSVVADRLEDDLQSCIAPTFVVVPSRVKISPAFQKTNSQVMSYLTTKNVEALPHHHIPLSSLVTAEGTLPYDTLLAFQAFDKCSTKARLWNKVEFPAMEHDFAVMIEIWPSESGSLRLRATFTYSHLDQAASQIMLRQLDDVIAFICDSPDALFLETKFAVNKHLLSHFPMALDEEQPVSESDTFLHYAFEQQALKTPEKPAILFKQTLDGSSLDVTWTYGELYDLARAFAASLVEEYGSFQNLPIMLCMEKCAELYVAVLGILLAGAGWCPIDPYSPPARQRAIMEQTGSRLLIVSPTASNVDEHAIPAGVVTVTLNLASLQAIIAQKLKQKRPISVDPSHLAYLIFTSGTTGLPKGVPISHRSAAIATNALAKAIPSDVTRGDVRCMQFSQYTFDVFVQDLFYTWTVGGTVISSPRHIMIQNFADLANSTNATHAHLTPAFSATLSRQSIKTLEVVTMIGEKLTEAVADDWGTDMRAYNTYGPAEVTVVSTLRQFTGKSDSYFSSNVGIPLPSVGTYVLEDGRAVMRGAIGELALAGPQLSSGYWGMPEVNAKVFTWNDQLHQKLYMTGDLVRHLADGTINFVGRNDDLVKLGGIRVELGEIAFALRNADSRIEQFEVLHCVRKCGDEKLVVAFLACPSLADDTPEIGALLGREAQELVCSAREYGRTVLPPYMLPATYIALPRIPRTASAKIDRAALTAIYHSLDFASWNSDIDGPPAPLEDHDVQWRLEYAKLLRVIADTLRISVGSLRRSNNLHAIGMDSIGAIRLVPKLNAMGFNMSVVDAFRCRTLEDFCQIAASSVVQKHSNPQDLSNILQSFDAKYYLPVSKFLDNEDVSVIPTTVLQESLLTETLKNPDAYWSTHFFKLAENIEIARLKRAWIKVARQTEALRAGYVAKEMIKALPHVKDGDNLSFLQVIYEEPMVDWSEQSLSEPLQVVVDRRVAAIAKHHHTRLFKLPPWALDIFHTEGESSVMMLTIHHSIYDGPSLEFLEAEVTAYYNRNVKTTPLVSYREAVAAKSALQADSEECVTFWRNSLQGLDNPHEEQDTTAQNPLTPNHRITTLRSEMSYAELRATSDHLGLSSMTTILRAAWAIILSNLLEAPQVIFGEILSDRVMNNNIAKVVGPMISTVPSVFKSHDTAAATMLAMDEFSRSAWIHRNIRPGTVKSILKRDASAHVYPAMFAFHPAVDNDNSNIRRLWHRMDDITQIQVEQTFVLNIWQDSEAVPLIELAVADHFMTAAEQNLLVRQLDALIGALVKFPNSTLSSLTDGFSSEIISRTTPRKTNNCPSPHSPTYWVEHWARLHPDWKGAEIVLNINANGSETVSWTYAELNAEANRIAHLILERGIAKRMIGMCLGRTLRSYAVVLGILKSGNTYLPIDESLPAARKTFLLEDSSSAVVFTDAELFDEVQVPQGCQLVDIGDGDFSQRVDSMDISNPSIDTDPRDNAYLLYTSGSTGRPKGVLVSRGNLASFAEAQAEFICDVTDTEKTAGTGKYLGLASRAFDVHLGEMFLAWKFGVAAVTAPRSLLLDDLAVALSSLQITHASFVPSLLDQTGMTPEDAPDLVFLGVGGEKMSSKTKKLWGGHDRVRLINAYGPTEATIGLCSAPVFPQSDMRDIGIPMGDSEAHVLVPDTDHHVLRGMPGELCFTGSLIANGYLNRPDATGFVEDFGGKRMYRTGDIVKIGLDDHIYFLGRKDDQVKIRGQRVELGEVAEGVRTAAEQDVDVAALVIKHPALLRTQLVAFVAPIQSTKKRSSELPDIDRPFLLKASTVLRERCQKSLPSMLVPDIIVPLTFIPLAATSGKVDSKLIAKIFSSAAMVDLMPGGAAANGSQIPVRPMTDTETEILDLISSCLREKPSDATPASTLFQLGIDSLSGISVFSKLKSSGYQCTVAMVMKNPTIEQLASSKRKQAGQDNSSVADVTQILADTKRRYLERPNESLSSKDVDAVLPCLPLQEVLIAQSLHNSTDGTDSAYVNHIKLQLEVDVDIERMRLSWEKLVRANDILRTCFSTAGDYFLQVVLKTDSSDVPWQSLKMPHDIAVLQQEISKDIMAKLSFRPPLRLSAIDVLDGKCILLLSIHHALYDGSSLEMMLHDVQAIYHHGTSDPRSGSTPLVQYVLGQDRHRLQCYWATLLDKWETAPLLTTTPMKNVTLSTAERCFTARLSELESAASSHGVTLAALLQTAFAIALAQSLETNDIIFGNVLSGRTVAVENPNNILAPCITTIPQRMKLNDPQASLSAVLTAAQDAISDSLEYQHVSPRDIQKWTGADRALYDCLFSFIRIQAHRDQLQPLFRQEGGNIRVDYPLAVEFEANDEKQEVIVRAGYTDGFGSKVEAEILLEKIEMLTSVLTGQANISVESLGLSTSSTVRMAVDADEFEESSWTQLEQELRILICAFTGATEAEVQKNTAFIHLGIDSISAIRFAKELRNHGHNISSTVIVRHNRLGALSKYINSMSQDIDPTGKEETSNVDDQEIISYLKIQGIPDIKHDTEVYACTPLQAGMLAQSLATDGALYVHHHATRLAGNVDLVRLKAAWFALVSDLDVLRTTFHWLPDYKIPWVGAVHKDKAPAWEQIESQDPYRHWLQLSQISDFKYRIQNAETLANVQIVLSKQSPVLILTLHHAIYDGISLGMLYRRFASKYHNIEQPLAKPFFKAAKVIVKHAEASVSFWADQIKDYDGAPSVVNVNELSTLAERQIATNMLAFDDKCRKADIDVKDLCVAAFGKALACLHLKRDVVFGYVMAARHGSFGDGSDVVGPSFNTVPFRVTIKEQLMTNKDLIQQLHAVNSDSIEHQHASLAEVQKKWRTTAPNPNAQFIDSIFVYSKLEKSTLRGMDPFMEPLESDDSPVPSEYRLNFEVEHSDEGIVARALSFMVRGEVEILLDNFRDSIHDMINQPDRFATASPGPLRSLPLRSEAEQSSMETFDSDSVSCYAKVIRAAISDVAQVPADSITLNASIYAFGIDSIAAIQIVARCKKAGVRVSVADILKGATVGRICEIVATGNNERSGRVQAISTKSMTLISPAEKKAAMVTLNLSDDQVEDALPCLAGQEYYLMSWVRSGRTFYEPAWVYKATQRLDIDRLRAAWKQLREQNSVLRTTFAAVGPMRVIQIVRKADSTAHDTFQIHSDSRPLLEAVKDRVRQEQCTPSDLFNPPVRLRMVQAADGDALMVCLHHSLYDAWSMLALISELASIYHGTKLESPAPQFSELVHHIYGRMDQKHEEIFWRQTLSGCQATELQPACSIPVPDSLDRSQSFAMLEGKKVSPGELEKICSTYHISAHHVILVAFARVLAQETNTHSPLFGFYQIGRSTNFDGIAQVAGPCVNILPLGVPSVTERSVLQCAQELQAALRARIVFEQSTLRTAVYAFDPTATQLPFNTHINFLWHKSALVGSTSYDDLFQPLPIGVPTDYSSPRAHPGYTAVSALDASLIPPHQLFVDIGQGETGIIFGVRADAALMDVDGIHDFIRSLEDQVVLCMRQLAGFHSSNMAH